MRNELHLCICDKLHACNTIYISLKWIKYSEKAKFKNLKNTFHVALGTKP